MNQKPVLKGLDYLLELANPATHEDYLALVARIKPLVDVIEAGCNFDPSNHDFDMEEFMNREDAVFRALNGDKSARVSLGMEKGE